MSDIKYLQDGRKVVVIGKINNLEYIVQEIFVNKSGDEIPSGNKFTTKNLHDEPVISWEQRQLKVHKDELNHLENHLISVRKNLRQLQEKNKEYARLVHSAKVFSEILSPKELEIFEAVMTGTIEWLVIEDYGIDKLVKFDDWIVEESGRHTYDGGLRVIQIFGKSGGDLFYQTSTYNDGSGSQKKIHLFIDRDTAIEFITGRAIVWIEKEHFNIEDFKKCQALGIKIPVKLLRKVKSRLLAAKKKADKKENETQILNQKKRLELLLEITNMI